MSSTPQFVRQQSCNSITPSFSKFREHLDLSISPPGEDRPLEKSQFSPESIEQAPPSPPHGYLRSLKHVASAATKRSARTPSSAFHHLPNANADLESAGARSRRSFRDRFTQFFFDVRTIGRDTNSDGISIDLPMQDRWNLPITPPPAWPPLHVEKRDKPNTDSHKCACAGHKKRSCTSSALLVMLILVLLYLIADSVFVTVSILDLRRARAIPTPTSTATTSANNASLPADAQACLTQYMLNAPTSPSSYPCSTCLPLLQDADPAELAASATNSGYAAQTAVNAVQFCALRAVFASAPPLGQTALGNAGWVRDIKFCAWQGVGCDGTGKVSSLKLTFPAVPAVVPAELGALSGLTTLSIIGDGNSPSGKLPGEFTSLTSLISLRLESTALTTPPDIPSTLTSLQLIKNAAMSSTLPPSLFSSSLTTLIINDQPLTNPLAQITTSATLQSTLRTLDLTQTQLTGSVPSSLGNMRALAEVHLDGNALTGTVPKLGQGVVVTVERNPGLQGA